MTIEQEGRDEIVKRSPLTESLLSINNSDLTTTDTLWWLRFKTRFNSFNKTISKQHDPQWVEKTFDPSVAAINAMHPIFKVSDINIIAPLYGSIFGAGYEIGSPQSSIIMANEIVHRLDAIHALNQKFLPESESKQLLDVDEANIAKILSYRAIAALMIIGTSYKERGVVPFLKQLKDFDT